MKKVILSAGLALFVLVSCNNNDSGSDIDKSIIPEGQTVPGSTDAASASTSAPGMPMMGENPAMQPVQVNPQMVTTGGATGPLNPKHGEPGHRCDIPEGAPLNSKPAAASTPATATTATAAPTITQVSAPTATPAKVTAPGMNPPHGQPGHRCDIAEGAPLNSKPAAPKTEATPVQVTPVQAAPAAIKAEETKAAQPAAPAAAEEVKKDGN